MGSIPDRRGNFLFATTPKPDLGPTEVFFDVYRVYFPRDKTVKP
jgi:hypothetical protein